MNSLNERIRNVRVSKDLLAVELLDGRTITVPLAWYPTLLHANERERRTWKTCGAGTGIHWLLLDYHLSVQGLLDGLPEAAGMRKSEAALQSV